MFEDWNFNFESSTPYYLQIYNYIRGSIFSGRLPIGAKLPTQKEFAYSYLSVKDLEYSLLLLKQCMLEELN